MRFSKFYAPSFKEAPKDAFLRGHILLLRAGYIDQGAAGLYNFLPLGLKVLQKIKKIIRHHMDESGSNELAMSFAIKASLWEESGRLKAFGDELLKFYDRKDTQYVLAPTHEEALIELIRGKINSYKDLPLSLYQISSKFRDEARPRFGLLRCKEFIMKDAYSFHANEACLEACFENMSKTYSKIFKSLNLAVRIVQADSGAIGGSGSMEFMVESECGEDELLICSNCSYSANKEVAKRKPRICKEERPIANFVSKFYTPDIKTIGELASFLSIDAFYTIKAVVKRAIYEDESKLVVFFIRGDDELEESKATRAAKALELKDANSEELLENNLAQGFIGFINLNHIDFYLDHELENESNMIIGANQKDYHLIGIQVTNLKKERFCDLVRVKEGDLCPHCSKALKASKAIEVAHIFKLGQKYSLPMKANFLDENGKNKPFYMGCYGIGVSRLLAVLAELNHDERGLCFDPSLAAFKLVIIISNLKDKNAVAFANSLYEELDEVLLDDRNKSFGFKINDYELKGFPYALIIGKDFSKGLCELRFRKNLESKLIKKEKIKEELLKIL